MTNWPQMTPSPKHPTAAMHCLVIGHTTLIVSRVTSIICRFGSASGRLSMDAPFGLFAAAGDCPIVGLGSFGTFRF